MEVLLLLLSFVMFIGFREKDKFKLPLTRIEEKKYLKKYYDENDENARNILIERNLRLVANIAKKYQNPKNTIEDLISIGTIGLIKGIDTFKNENNNKLSTYISKCIENEILMHYRKTKKSNEDVYLEEIKFKDKDGNGMRLIDTIESDEKTVNDTVSDSINFEIVKDIFTNVLNDNEQYIIKKRYGIFGEYRETQEIIAEKLGISRSYVSRIEKTALLKLRKELKRRK